ncbi:hypothetical protein N5079_06720 [Planotetraspora sp. A-T 1434]|uniref:hypothetical protein n=1 Tax=Planotetraspora sp. A-T 1434 TaxID=2979219 RepID=UPI0021BE0527|nr:hypothetical protein [Planotetraspora sp. A-T 1434]MCT9929911.1 hypothetical protein [Planotetraspora sp. A-T 1434]
MDAQLRPAGYGETSLLALVDEFRIAHDALMAVGGVWLGVELWRAGRRWSRTC